MRSKQRWCIEAKHLVHNLQICGPQEGGAQAGRESGFSELKDGTPGPCIKNTHSHRHINTDTHNHRHRNTQTPTQTHTLTETHKYTDTHTLKQQQLETGGGGAAKAVALEDTRGTDTRVGPQPQRAQGQGSSQGGQALARLQVWPCYLEKGYTAVNQCDQI